MSKKKTTDLTPYIISVGLTASLIISAVVIWNWSARQTKHHIEAESYASYYLNDAAHEAENRCKFANVTDRTKCVVEAVDAAREAQHDAHDLEAQRSSAYWASWATIISAASTFLTFIGIWFVRENLLAVQKTNEIQTRIGLATIRAYVSVSEIEARIVYEGRLPCLHVKICLANGGSTPAIHPGGGVMIKRIGGGEVRIIMGRSDFRLLRDITPGENDYILFEQRQKVGIKTIDALNKREVHFIATGTISYKIAETLEVKSTPINLTIVGPLSADGRLEVRNNTYRDPDPT